MNTQTLIVLESPTNGVKMIKIIGSSHIAEESVKKITQIAEEYKPDIIAIELDAQRFSVLFEEPMTPKLKDIRTLGLVGYIFAKIGGELQQTLGSRVGLRPGEDMRAAVFAARKVSAKIALVDQPINITLRKLSTELKWWEKLNLFFFLIGAAVFPPEFGKRKIDLRKVPPQDLINKVIREIKKKLPKLYKVLIGDRNKYMAKALKKLASQNPKSKILVIVGAGHEKDLKKLLKKKR